MRLEDWQKWLDSQFVDAEEVQKQAEMSAPVEEAPVSHGMIAPPQPASVAPPVNGHASVIPPPQPEAPPVKQEPSLPTYVAPTSTSSPVAASSGVVDDIDVPSIERYMPFLRQAPPHSTEPQPPAAPAETVEAVEQAETPAAEAADQEPVTATATSVPETIEAAATEEAPTESPAAEPEEQPDLELTIQAASEEPSVDGRSQSRQSSTITQKRARHARNIRPTDIVEELADGGLWGLVPKHIQVLVAMGSDEVAQNSYKRSFKENRLELINRLLDPTLSLEDTARLLNVCPTTVRRYTNRGLLTHQRTPGDQRRFKLSDVLAFLEAQSRVR